ncbi:MAG: sigma 54-interacting transcriptional regulator [Proteobacteria bacterium]|nr:sigma 54-interacting transcriptional regulator [Pseudomonadota bacterium]
MSTPTATPHLFLILESRRPHALSARYSLAEVDEVVIGRGKTRSVERRAEDGIRRLIVRVPDPWMSSTHARIQRRATLCTFADENSTNGSVINGAPASSVTLKDNDIIELGQTFFLYRSSVRTTKQEPPYLDASEITAPEGLLSLIPTLAQRFAELAQVVKSNTSVVILGQSGTGKEVIAKASHKLSGRAGSFVAVNCGALPDSLVESEFFGHKKGAFSGASDDRRGLVLAADRGTLFLDEIGDLPLNSQAALLRVLQEREVTPVGATSPIPVDFRLVCATHRNMEALVEDGSFREDLLARLAGFIIDMPSLDQRKEDMGILIGVLLGKLNEERDSTAEIALSNDVARALLAYNWPRNIRELRTCLQTAIALAGNRMVELDHLGPTVRQALDEQHSQDREATPTGRDSRQPLSPEQEHRRAQLIQLLREHQGNISAVARAMGKVRSQVQRWIKRYGLDAESFRTQ